MSRINTNVTALIGARILNTNKMSLDKSLERLSTGLRINRGADDPAGLIASENLRQQITGTETAIKNAQRANNIVGTAEGALSDVSAMLLDLQALLGEVANSGGMSPEEIAANQLQVDSILESINRVANTSEFNGIKLLNGNLGYTTSGVNTTYMSQLRVNSAKLIDGNEMIVNVSRVSAAATGQLRLSGAGLSGNSPLVMQIASNRGTTELTFAGSTKISAIVYGINQVREITGVSAALSGATVAANLYSVDYGSDAYVSVEILSGSQSGSLKLAQAGSSAHLDTARDTGVDAIATVGGTQAVAQGKSLTVRTAMMDMEIELDTAAATTAADWNTSFAIVSGGADFALGAKVDAIGLEALGFNSISTSKLGHPDHGYLSSLRSGGDNSLTGDNVYTAQNIVNSAIKDISRMRGRLGSFQKNTLNTAINQLQVSKENLWAAESALRDTDFATETSKLTRGQILVNAATSVLAQANFAPQSVLSLLG